MNHTQNRMQGVMEERSCAACKRLSHINKNEKGVKCAYCGAEFLPEPEVKEEAKTERPRVKV